MAKMTIRAPKIGVSAKPHIPGPPRGTNLNRIAQRPPRLIPRSRRNYAKNELPLENTDMSGGGFGDTGSDMM